MINIREIFGSSFLFLVLKSALKFVFRETFVYCASLLHSSRRCLRSVDLVKISDSFEKRSQLTKSQSVSKGSFESDQGGVHSTLAMPLSLRGNQIVSKWTLYSLRKQKQNISSVKSCLMY